MDHITTISQSAKSSLYSQYLYYVYQKKTFANRSNNIFMTDMATPHPKKKNKELLC